MNVKIFYRCAENHTMRISYPGGCITKGSACVLFLNILFSVMCYADPLPPDINRDGRITLPDFSRISASWLSNGDADLDGSGQVGLGDLARLAQYWLEGAGETMPLGQKYKFNAGWKGLESV